jgi:hypothetical protein
MFFIFEVLLLGRCLIWFADLHPPPPPKKMFYYYIVLHVFILKRKQKSYYMMLITNQFTMCWQIVKIRDPEQQLEMVGVPEEHIQGHAFHLYHLTSPDDR